MDPVHPHRATAWLYRLPALAIAAAGLTWLTVLVLRAGYPFHLEWLESNVFCHALRFARGWPLYEDPARGLPSHPYGPLYYIVCGGLLKVLPTSLLVCRAVSQIATLWSAVCIALLARRWSGKRSAALMAPLAWFAFLPSTGCWFDLARVDSLATALLLQGIVWLEGSRGFDRRWWAATAVLSLSALTKQSCLPLALAAWACSPALRVPRRWVLGGALTVAITGLVYLALDAATDGMLLYYALDLPLSHAQDWRAVAALVLSWLVLPLPLVALAALAIPWAGRREAKVRALCLWLLTAIVCAWTSTKQGAFLNHYMPLAALSAVLASAAVSSLGGLTAALRPVLGALALTAAATLGLLFGDPAWQVPTRADREAGEAWVAWLSAAPVEVQIPAFNYLPVLAGQGIHVHEMGAFEVFDHWAHKLVAERGERAAAERMLAHPDIAAITGRSDAPTAFVIALDPNSQPGLSFFHPHFLATQIPRMRWDYADKSTFRCRIGLLVRPELIYVMPDGAAVELPPLPPHRIQRDGT